MRAILNAKGKPVMKDGPIRVQGDAAKRLLTEMKQLDKSGHSKDTQRFLDECERVFKSSRTGRSD